MTVTPSTAATWRQCGKNSDGTDVTEEIEEMRAMAGKASPLPACPHLGPATGEKVTCPTCAGKVELKVFGCAVHGKCTTGKKAEGVACCAGCPDRPKAAH